MTHGKNSFCIFCMIVCNTKLSSSENWKYTLTNINWSRIVIKTKRHKADSLATATSSITERLSSILEGWGRKNPGQLIVYHVSKSNLTMVDRRVTLALGMEGII
jgi:hypothetical protein